MTMTDPMLAKIRKLLAKAEDPATTPAEAELFTAKATELVAEYGIDQALLEHDRSGHDVVGNRVVVLDRPYAADKADLLGTLALRLRCACVRRSQLDDGARQLSLHVFGHESDLLRVEMLFTSLLVQATHALSAVPVPAWEHKAAFRRSWMAGFSAAIGHRLREAEHRAEQAADVTRNPTRSSTAVVLADRSSRVQDALRDAYPHLTSGRRRSLSGSGGAAGFAAGTRADIGGTHVDGRTRHRLPSA